jgi:hypothetical protein
MGRQQLKGCGISVNYPVWRIEIVRQCCEGSAILSIYEINISEDSFAVQ